MTNPSPTDLIYQADFEVHQTQEGLYWLGNTYQGDHCAPTDRMSEDMTAEELRRRFDSYLSTGYTQTAREHMYSLFNNEWAYYNGMRCVFEPDDVDYEVGCWVFELTIRLETGELFKGFSAFNTHINPYSNGPIPTQQEAMERVRQSVQKFIEPRNPDPNHQGFTPPCITEIKGFVIAKGYRDERSFKVKCKIAVPFGEPIPEFKELTPEEQRIPPSLELSMPW
jgi:hypothetical protein